MADRLTTDDHDRGATGMRYVYAVVSRRSGGISVGVNLNPNRACNWRCIYCQVPGLERGAGPPIDLDRLENELGTLLADIQSGDFVARRAPRSRLRDVAFSGDGEPTTSPDLIPALERVRAVFERRGLIGKVPLILITNGSRSDRPDVAHALGLLAESKGEIWFKLDAGDDAGMEGVNSVRVKVDAHLERLRKAASICPTWIQSCFFALDGALPDAADVDSYLDALGRVADHPGVRGVLLYGLARPSHQPEAARLSALPESWLQELAARVQAKGLTCRVSP